MTYMQNKLYVGGLPYSTTDQELRDAFGQAGTVTSVTIIMDKFSGRSKGFGFIEMSSDEEAQKAIQMWHDQDFGGRKLTVNVARPMEERAPRSGGFDRGPRDFNRSGGRGGGFNDRRGGGGGFSRGGQGGSFNNFRRGSR